MRFTLSLAYLLLTLASFGQKEKDLTVSVSAGSLNSPYYKKAKPSLFAGFDFDYHLTKRQVLSVNYFAGRHRYFDDALSNVPNGFYYSDGRNATARYSTVSVLYKYKIINGDGLSLVAGTGAGILTHEQEYYYQRGTSGGPETSSWSDLVFPVSLDFNFKLTRRFSLGAGGGFLIHPDYPVLAIHAGPRLSYTLR